MPRGVSFHRYYMISFFKRWSTVWHSSTPFILIWNGSKNYRLIFPDEAGVLNSEKVLRDEIHFEPMNLRELRLQKGWDLKELAKRSGIGLSNLVALERGRRKMGLKTKTRLAAVLLKSEG